MLYRTGIHTLAIIMWCLGASVATAAAASGGGDLWKGLQKGPYQVGVAIRHERDPDRMFGAQNAPRPIQMLVWYPATKAAGKKRVTYENYFISSATEVVFSTTKPEYERRHIQEVRDMARTSGASTELFDRQMARPTWAISDATPATGVFPLVIYAPGQSGKSFQNVVLCEFLASHGFVVAASPSVGPHSREMPQTLDGMQAQIDDIRFVMKTMAKIRYVNAGRTGIIGYSWGGMSALLAAMGDEVPISAVAALDPHLMVKKGHDLARTAPGYAPQDLHIPVMLPIASAQEWKERDLGFFHELTGSRAMLLEFNDFKHGDFSSVIIQFIQETRTDRKKKESDRIRLGYATLCRYLEAFFSAHLQDDGMARAFLEAGPAENRVPADVLTIQRSSPQATASR